MLLSESVALAQHSTKRTNPSSLAAEECLGCDAAQNQRELKGLAASWSVLFIRFHANSNVGDLQTAVVHAKLSLPNPQRLEVTAAMCNYLIPLLIQGWRVLYNHSLGGFSC